MPIGINGSGTITGISAGGLPDGTIVQADLASGVAGTGPAFAAYSSLGQSLSAGVATKIQFNVERFDTNNCFDNATNFRFVPTVAGYYQVNGGAQVQSGASVTFLILFKNGVEYQYSAYYGIVTAQTLGTISALVYMNGTTDYLELYINSNANTSLYTAALTNSFSASLVRAA